MNDHDHDQHRSVGGYAVGLAGPEHLEGARSVMLDTFYHVFGYGYRPEWHADVVDLAGTYLRTPRHALFVATRGGEVVGTTAVRAVGPKSPPHPGFLLERYPASSTAQLFRVYVRPAHRRRGLARALVELAVRFVASQPGYRVVYLHTDPRVEGAEAFWRTVATCVYDPCGSTGGSRHRTADTGRTAAGADDYRTMHFEIPLPAVLPAPA